MVMLNVYNILNYVFKDKLKFFMRCSLKFKFLTKITMTISRFVCRIFLSSLRDRTQFKAKEQLRMKEKTKLVLGVIGADCHAVGNKILNHALNAAGFEVVNLGVLVPQEEFVNAAIETDAKAILVGSLYGHGEIDCRGLRERCQEAGIGDILLYVGGNLVVGKTDFSEVLKKFLAMGYNRVYEPGILPDQVVSDLQTDLK
jgi:methylaspartate mutase sigma subunit